MAEVAAPLILYGRECCLYLGFQKTPGRIGLAHHHNPGDEGHEKSGKSATVLFRGDLSIRLRRSQARIEVFLATQKMLFNLTESLLIDKLSFNCRIDYHAATTFAGRGMVDDDGQDILDIFQSQGLPVQQGAIFLPQIQEIVVDALMKQTFLAGELLVHAVLVKTGGSDQIAHRGPFEAFDPEDLGGSIKDFVSVVLFCPCHFCFLFLDDRCILD